MSFCENGITLPTHSRPLPTTQEEENPTAPGADSSTETCAASPFANTTQTPFLGDSTQTKKLTVERSSTIAGALDTQTKVDNQNSTASKKPWESPWEKLRQVAGNKVGD